jgi:hypothetical protein
MLHLKLINIRREGARPIGLRSGVVPLLEIAPQPWVATEPQSRRPHLTRLALRLRLHRPAARWRAARLRPDRAADLQAAHTPGGTSPPPASSSIASGWMACGDRIACACARASAVPQGRGRAALPHVRAVERIAAARPIVQSHSMRPDRHVSIALNVTASGC